MDKNYNCSRGLKSSEIYFNVVTRINKAHYCSQMNHWGKTNKDTSTRVLSLHLQLLKQNENGSNQFYRLYVSVQA